jgi:hypothetical protein
MYRLGRCRTLASALAGPKVSPPSTQLQPNAMFSRIKTPTDSIIPRRSPLTSASDSPALRNNGEP